MGNLIGRTTSKNLGGALTSAKDTALAFVRVGNFFLVWQDKSKRARRTTISTTELFLKKGAVDDPR